MARALEVVGERGLCLRPGSSTLETPTSRARVSELEEIAKQPRLRRVRIGVAVEARQGVIRLDAGDH